MVRHGGQVSYKPRGRKPRNEAMRFGETTKLWGLNVRPGSRGGANADQPERDDEGIPSDEPEAQDISVIHRTETGLVKA